MRKDGSVMWVREVVRPVRDADGELVFLIVGDDVTDAKRVEAERERLLARQQFLDEARRVLAGSLDYEATLQTVARLAVPMLGDVVIVDVIGDAGGLRRIAVALANPEQEALAREAEGSPPDLALKDHPVNRAIRTRHSQILSGEEAMRAAAFSAEQFDLMRRLGPRSVLVVPLIARGRALGAIVFISLAGESAREYGPEDVPLAEELARSAGVAIDNARLYAEAEQRAREETALREAVGALSAALSTQELIRRIATSAVKATGARGAFVTMIDAEREEVEVIGVAGEIPLPEGRIPYAHSYTRRVIEHGEPLRIRHFAEVEGHLRESPLARACPECSADATPLVANERAIGALFIMFREEPPALSPESRTRLRTFGELASLAFRRLQLLEESERRRNELERVTESRARLIRGLSHDVKNPLGAAAGYAALLLEPGALGELSVKQREGVERISRSIQISLRLIEDSLEVARAETGKINVERARTDVGQLVREVSEEFRAQATAAGLTVECRASKPVFAETDAIRVRQIVGNLLSNAVKYTPRGSITVDIAVRDGAAELRPGEWVAVSVTDTGLGISADKYEQVFQEFTRLHPEVAGGVGVGLANSRRIARGLGGDITIRSEVGGGSTFTLWLPPAASADEGLTAPDECGSPGRRRAPARLQPGRRGHGVLRDGHRQRIVEPVGVGAVGVDLRDESAPGVRNESGTSNVRASSSVMAPRNQSGPPRSRRATDHVVADLPSSTRVVSQSTATSRMNWNAGWSRVVLRKIGRHLQRRVEHDVERELLGQRGADPRLLEPARRARSSARAGCRRSPA